MLASTGKVFRVIATCKIPVRAQLLVGFDVGRLGEIGLGVDVKVCVAKLSRPFIIGICHCDWRDVKGRQSLYGSRMVQ